MLTGSPPVGHWVLTGDQLTQMTAHASASRLTGRIDPINVWILWVCFCILQLVKYLLILYKMKHYLKKAVHVGLALVRGIAIISRILHIRFCILCPEMNYSCSQNVYQAIQIWSGGLAQMVERVLSMHKVQGSMLESSKFIFVFVGNECLLAPKRLHGSLSCWKRGISSNGRARAQQARGTTGINARILHVNFFILSYECLLFSKHLRKLIVLKPGISSNGKARA